MSDNVIYLQAPDKSEKYDKIYANLILENGMHCLVISDPSNVLNVIEYIEERESLENNSLSDVASNESFTDLNCFGEMAVFCVAVGVGSFSNPTEYPGLAHFLQHMIFLGSDKYPKENALTTLIQECGGYIYTTTEDECTLFCFKVPNNYLDSTMDYFSAALQAPKLPKELMQEEIYAIESDFRESVTNNEKRLNQILADLANKNFPHSKFAMGNLKSLKTDIKNDDDLLQALRDFHKSHYSAHRMKLCVQAHIPVTYMEYFVEKNFSKIPNNKLPGIDFEQYKYDQAFSSTLFDNIIFIKPKKRDTYVELMWVLPPIIQNYTSKPADIVAYVIGHPGTGSLTSYLRKKSWISDLQCGVNKSSSFNYNSIYSLFKIRFSLTDSGFQNLPNVIAATFAYINMLPVADAFKAAFDEIKFLYETEFHYKTEMPSRDNVLYLAGNMIHFSPAHILTGDPLLFDFEPYMIKIVLDRLKYSKYSLIVSTNREVKGNVRIMWEKWYSNEYFAIPFPKAWRKLWKYPPRIPELSLPQSNKYMCKDFRIFFIKNNKASLPQTPQKILKTKVAELWFQQDFKDLIPQAFMVCKFLSPLPRQSAENAMLLAIYANLINYNLEEEFYAAKLAGIYGKLYATDSGLLLSVHGYNEKLPLLIDTILKVITNLPKYMTKQKFEICKVTECASINNLMKRPKKLIDDVRLSIVENIHWTMKDKCEASQMLHYADMIQFCNICNKELYIKALIQGNIKKETAKNVMSKILKKIKCAPIKNTEYIKNRVCQMPLGTNNLEFQQLSNTNATTYNYYQIGPTSIYLETLLELLIVFVRVPMSDTLENNENLAYSVSIHARVETGIIGYTICVTSKDDIVPNAYVEERIELFRYGIKKLLENVTDEDFDAVRNAQIKLKMASGQLSDRVLKNWKIINEEVITFDREKEQIEILKNVTKEQLIEFWVKNEQNNYRKLSVQMFGQSSHASDIAFPILEVVENTHEQYTNGKVTNINKFATNLHAFPTSKEIIEH